MVAMEIPGARDEWKQVCSTETTRRLDGWMPCDVLRHAVAQEKGEMNQATDCYV